MFYQQAFSVNAHKCFFLSHISYNYTEGLTVKQSHERYLYIINQMGFDLNTNVFFFVVAVGILFD